MMWQQQIWAKFFFLAVWFGILRLMCSVFSLIKKTNKQCAACVMLMINLVTFRNVFAHSNMVRAFDTGTNRQPNCLRIYDQFKIVKTECIKRIHQMPSNHNHNKSQRVVYEFMLLLLLFFFVIAFFLLLPIPIVDALVPI